MCAWQLTQPSDNAVPGSAVMSDWRADILRAVHDVFARDLHAVHADLRTYTLRHSGDGSDVLDALERTISAQVKDSFYGFAAHVLQTKAQTALVV